MQDDQSLDSDCGAIGLLANLCSEAIERHGVDRPAIERYVAEKIDAMGEGDRFRLSSRIEAVLKFATYAHYKGATH